MSSRQPSLSLDTRNLAPPSGRTPSPAPLPALQTDLSSFKAGLEMLWSRCSTSIHTLHSVVALERDAHKRTMRELDKLSANSARMWEEKTRVEAERRELRAKLDAQAAVADARERASGSRDVRVKMEDTDDDDNVSVPMREVQRMIEERLQSQADECMFHITSTYVRVLIFQIVARETTELYSVRFSNHMVEIGCSYIS